MSDTRPQGQPDEAMVDLLIKQVTEGVAPAEQWGVDAVDSERAGACLRDLERAAAAVTLAGSLGGEPLPAALSARIAQQAAEHFAAAEHSAQPGNVANLSEVRTATAEKARVQPSLAPSPAPTRATRFGAYGWLAAAACFVLAIFGWERSPPSLAPVAVVATPPVAPQPPPPP